jgi:hypothetical protein
MNAIYIEILEDERMKKLKLIIIALMLFTLTGCIQEYNYTEETSDSIAEYMAGTLLVNDASMNQMLVPLTYIYEENEDKTSEQGKSPLETTDQSQETDSSPNANNETSNTTLTDLIGNKDFGIKYKGYQLLDTYPEAPGNTDFIVEPRNGYQLLVVSFQADNLAKSKKELNLIKSDIKYQLDVNGGTVYKPQLTLLENDLQYINITIPGGKSEIVILIFEVSKEASISDISLNVSKNGKSSVIEIK